MNKNYKVCVGIPWYFSLLKTFLDLFSVWIDTKQDTIQNRIECDVILSGGVKGVATFFDLFEVDYLEGKFSLWRTALKRYNSVKFGNDPNVIVRYSNVPEDWDSVPKEEVIFRGEPVSKRVPYSKKLYAVKLLGFIFLRYEEHSL